jgi:hypothetical protein
MVFRKQMMDEEQAFRTRLAVACAGLQGTLPADRNGPRVFEEVARKLTTQPGHTPAMVDALKEFDAAVNAYWLYAESAGIANKLATHFVKKHRLSNFRELDEVSADATMLMRGIVILHALSATKAPLWVFAFPRVERGLLDENARAAGIPLNPAPRARGGARHVAQSAEQYRADLDTSPAAERREYEGLAASPEDELLEREEATGVSVWGHRS